MFEAEEQVKVLREALKGLKNSKRFRDDTPENNKYIEGSELI